MNICAHTLVKNEEKYIWYSIMSVIDYVDKIMVWDTGSGDRTIELVKDIKKKFKDKVELETFGEVTPEKFTLLRQKMLDRTKSDWVMLLDGDEVWWDESINKVTKFIKKKGSNYDTIVTPYLNVVGDIYHFQEEKAGMYKIDGRKGHLTVRFMNMGIPGLHVSKPMGQQGYFDEDGKLIQERDKKKRRFMDKSYMHFTNVPRSSGRDMDLKVPKRKMKLKYEIGHASPYDFYYPEVFFKKRPSNVPSVWTKMQSQFRLKSLGLTLPRKVKRRVYQGKSGY
jgi:hypothetical protein